ncbi:hypothetical protein TW95_gp0771 [Pandoravirus inopinatum]|uniref:Uncharacterized protein n=1 Tax=Pandoravirus inopinatum TaxID=1605721 RepID=A0A0B5J6T9_9VIRU|nr:hypothetical protein TW95_gp0771 [Pandoravirus inopinatum]AJF97505.1 hypothetical protein [Pandoravirus inopinatum]
MAQPISAGRASIVFFTKLYFTPKVGGRTYAKKWLQDWRFCWHAGAAWPRGDRLTNDCAPKKRGEQRPRRKDLTFVHMQKMLPRKNIQRKKVKKSHCKRRNINSKNVMYFLVQETRIG